ncbi:DUF4328 domain-containing protein [Gordonia rubripertincta]|uniref:DUF4328 domain-containing protein n=2 Tax=Mycobacteriales TaxID=85007 RepID=A0ABT4MQZ3_GORRU|nr:DUF4328 domain-containing protein [Gordonia rubripertincta]MCZ4549425.1 DUF4328 domain-containing protein [Gordonia rubripertincta]
MSGPQGGTPSGPPARDYCPRCRIAGPHDISRPHCPRCGGPLTPLDAYGRVAQPVRMPAPPMPRAQANNMYVPPRSSPARPAPARPTGGPARGGRARVRWVALRPPSARPKPRVDGTAETGPTPRYEHTPGWGLRDFPPIEPAEPQRGPIEWLRDWLPSLLLAAAGVLVLAAAAESWIYALLVVNLEDPISRPMQVAAETAVWITGLAAVVLMVACLVGVAGWLIDERAKAYSDHEQLDPRSRRQLMIGLWVPVLSLFWPVAFFRELLDRRDDLLPVHTRKRLWWLWSGWLAVNGLVVVGVLVRIFAESLVWQANAVVLVIISNLVSAAFAGGLWWTITRLFAREAPATAPTRWLAAV